MVLRSSSLPKGVISERQENYNHANDSGFCCAEPGPFHDGERFGASHRRRRARGRDRCGRRQSFLAWAIEITNLETDFTATAESSGAGNYVMVNIPVGP